ncbi:MAG TPA: cytochrome P450 [Bryobacteraceae bacterium]|nr:cytochrome P450 [Bryobacteraceae bacterium]
MKPLGRPPGPRGRPFLGHLPEFRRQPAEFLLELARTYGDIAYFKAGPRHIYLLNRPDFIQDVLVNGHRSFTKSLVLQRAKRLLGEGLLTSEGDFHLRQRRLVQPMFYRERLESYAATMSECARATAERWQPGETRDIADEMMRLTLAIVGRTLFSRDVEHEASDIGRALTDVLGTFDTLMLPFSSAIQKLPLPRFVRARRALKFLDATIYRMISERRESGADVGDLLSMLLLSVDEEGSGGMTDRQVRDEAITLFLAGHETTATALTWTLYLLSQNPEAEQQMRAELSDVLGERSPAYDDLPNLRYTEMVFAEALRLYPPAWTVGRMTKTDTRIYNYEVPRGAICLLSPFVMHRHPRYYPEPERFDPLRFTPEAKQTRPKFAYFPFGGGPRVCIGERFAWMEGVLVLATLAQRWKFSLVPGQKIETHPQITLRTRYGLKMTVQPANAR